MPSRDPDLPPESASAIPSFGSLRDPRRRSAADVLFPAHQPPETLQPPRAAARPPEWSDLLHLAVHVVRWSLRAPLHGVRRLLGG